MFTKIVIVDLEATCWEWERDPAPPVREGCIYSGEIIEIGSVSLTLPEFERIAEFGSFVRPQDNPLLSSFCTELTTIRQEDVDGAPSFEEAVKSFVDAHGLGREDVLWASWGFYDRKQMADDFRKRGREVPDWVDRHVNLKEVVRSVLGMSKRRTVSLRKVLNHVGGEQVGTKHRGIDDARTYALLMRNLVGKKGVESVMEAIESLTAEKKAEDAISTPSP